MQRVLFNCLTFGIVAIFGHNALASETSISNFARTLLSDSKILYIGELHTVAEHKSHLKIILTDLVRSGTIQNFALEFSSSDNNQILQQYLTDQNAIPGSASERKYFSQLHRAYSNMHNNSHVDSVMRLLHSLKMEFGDAFQVCAVDERGQAPDTVENGPKYQKLKQLPQSTQKMIEQFSGQTLEELAGNDSAWDREASIGVNIAKCGTHGRTLAFVGMFHALDLGRESKKLQWVNAIQYTSDLVSPNKVTSIGLWQAYSDKSLMLPNFTSTCQKAISSLQYPSAVSPLQLKPSLESCFTASQDGQTFSYKNYFNGFVVGPPGTRIPE